MPNLNYGVESISDTKKISGTNDANIEDKIDILKKMIENPQITQNELARELGVSRRTVQRMIETLVEDSKGIRVGSIRVGH